MVFKSITVSETPTAFWQSTREPGKWTRDMVMALPCMQMAPHTRGNSKMSNMTVKAFSNGFRVMSIEARSRRVWWKDAASSPTRQAANKRASSDATISSVATVWSIHWMMQHSRLRQSRDLCRMFISGTKRLSLKSRCSYSGCIRLKTCSMAFKLVFLKAGFRYSFVLRDASCPKMMLSIKLLASWI